MSGTLFRFLVIGWLVVLMLKCPYPLRAQDADSQNNKISSLTLCGVILTDGLSQSLVVLKDETEGKIHFFREGDRFKEYTILHIHENRLVLRKKDVLYQLFLKKKGYKHSIPMPTEESEEVFSSSDNKKDTKIVKKEFFREEVEKRIEAEWPILIKGTEIVPHWENGKKNGLKIIRLPGGSILSELGIHENDVLKRINGSALYDPYVLVGHFQNLPNVNDFQIILLRKQKTIVIECVLKTQFK